MAVWLLEPGEEPLQFPASLAPKAWVYEGSGGDEEDCGISGAWQAQGQPASQYAVPGT